MNQQEQTFVTICCREIGNRFPEDVASNVSTEALLASPIIQTGRDVLVASRRVLYQGTPFRRAKEKPRIGGFSRCGLSGNGREAGFHQPLGVMLRGFSPEASRVRRSEGCDARQILHG